MNADLTTNDRLTRLEGEVSGLKAGQERMFQDLGEIKRAISSSGKTNWPIIIAGFAAIAGIAVPSIAAFYLFSSLQAQNQIASLRSEEIAPLEAKAEISIRDRGEIHGETIRNSDAISDLKNTDAKTLEMLKEIETQMKLVYDIANLRQSHADQFTSLLWKKVYGEDFPLSSYYPQPKQM